MSRIKSLSNILRMLKRPNICESNRQISLLSVNLVSHFSNRSNETIREIKGKNYSVPDSTRNPDLSDYGPPVLPSFNLAAYADKSPLLQEFIKLGVQLHKIEKNPNICEFLLTLDFEKHVKPYLLFLHDNNVPAEELGQFITKNPFIFKEDLQDLQVRINYLESKKFDPKMISNIITKYPQWLSVPVKRIDGRLGYFQQTLNLKGDEVRALITRAPYLVGLPKRKLLQNIFILKEEIDLDDYSLKKLVLNAPYLLKKDTFDIMSTYDYITRKMMIPLDLILKQPSSLTTRKFILSERHRYLQSLGRAQYNPLLPGYISLLSIVDTNDEEFCNKVSKTSIHSYNDFLKTL